MTSKSVTSESQRFENVTADRGSMFGGKSCVGSFMGHICKELQKAEDQKYITGNNSYFRIIKIKM